MYGISPNVCGYFNTCFCLLITCKVHFVMPGVSQILLFLMLFGCIWVLSLCVEEHRHCSTLEMLFLAYQ